MNALQLKFCSAIVLLSFCQIVARAADDREPKVSAYASAAEIRRHPPSGWTVITAQGKNTTQVDGEAFVAAYVAPQTAQHFSRRLWIPPNSIRTTWLPVRMPGARSKQERQTITTMVLDGSGSREVLKRRQGDLLTSEVIVTIDHQASKTLTYFRNPMPDKYGNIPDLDDDAYKTVILARKTGLLDSSILSFEGRYLPPWPDVFQDVDVIVLTADRIVEDSGGVATLRAWIRNGGRLWIMLDRVSPATVAAVLGNAFQFDIVDRVPLDQFVLETSTVAKPEVVTDRLEFEEPVELLRVVTSATDIETRVNGWPASIWIPYGQGEVLVTALAPRGWRGEFGENATNALKSLTTRMFNNRIERVTAKALSPSLHEQIGYHIPPRAVALAVLGGYSLCLVGFGFVLFRKQRLDWLAWAVPVLTLGTTAGLFAFGTSNTSSVPPTIAYSQLLRVAPETGELRIDGTAAIYDQSSREIDIKGMQLNWVMPEAGDQAEIRRWIWTDNDQVEMQNEKSLAGSVRAVEMQGVGTLDSSNSAVAEFGPDGLVGRLNIPSLRNPTDAVICSTPAPSSAVSLTGNGQFMVRPEDVLATDQFTVDALLSDEQRRRQNVMRALLNTGDTIHYPRSPTILFWCAPYQDPVEFPQGFKVAGSALAAIPIDLRRTPPKTSFRIPATFLKPEILVGQHGASTAYDPRTGKWVRGLTTASESTLRFAVPQQVLPANLTGAVLSLRLNAPSRTVTVFSFRGDEKLEVASRANLNGVWDVTLRPDQLHLDDRGGLRMAVAIGETEKQQANRQGNAQRNVNPSDPEQLPDFDNSTWQVDYIRLSVSGDTQ